ncbi:helix-turn-helix domain-containing protein [Eleftheria terrae]|uniref:helix-turn-helix domain-containing protein n=1 Tax=Eleftheria terrae TaxID=1597781 RepID=UPI00263BB62C|nr:helix-turn-helix domain-containing protein [Eleftheria terrae]WKB55556.1 hypothetical protein N7L95_26140 [Eleftheria terrae]
MKPREVSVLKGLLRRKGIPQKSWARVVAGIIGGTPKTAARRLTDESILSLQELFAIADHFGTTVTALLQADFPEERQIPGTRKAVLHVGGGKWPCTVVTRKAASGRSDLFVAYEQGTDGQLVVCQAGDAPPGSKLEGVLSFHVDAFGTAGPLVVVLDDEETATLPLCRFLRIDAGFDAQYFKEPEGVLALLQSEPRPDAYILDWTLSRGRTSRSVIEAIRTVDAASPIVLLTGTIQSREKNESEIADLVRTHRIDVCVKPFPASIVAEKLKSMLDRQAQLPHVDRAPAA